MRHHLRSNTWTVTATLRQDHGEDPGWWLTFTDREGQPLRFSMSDREPPEEGIWWRMWQHRQLPEVILDHLEERRTGWWS